MRQILNWQTARKAEEICVMAPTQLLAEKTLSILDRMGCDGVDVVVAASGRREIVDCSMALAAKGTKVIITRKGTKRIAEETTDLRVVGLHNSLLDYLWMLKERGLHTPGMIAFFSYDPISEDILEMCRVLGIRAKNYIFKTIEDCSVCVSDAIRDGAVFSVGGAWTAPVAQRMGLPHALLENTEETIVNALETALQLQVVQREEEEKQQVFKTRMETYQAVLNFTHDAILSIDDQARIQVLNPVAERIVQRKAADIIGRPVDEVLPNTMLPEVLRSGETQLNQIMQIHKTMTNSNRVPIEVDGKIRGVVATFQDVKQLQSTEQNIRLKLHEKGLVAKYDFSDIIGESRAIRETIEIARSYAASQAAVLILGETGTGKELFAQSIHNASDRRNGPFVAINCAAVSNSLLESELFGYEAGAFTGAAKNGRAGVFELAHGGTIFLDEIGEIPRETQVELLRVLQEKEVRRVGGSRVIPVDVRILTATNKDLLRETMEGRFREDLYYRLNVLELKLPPLRERQGDVRLIGLDCFHRFSGGDDPDLEQRFLRVLDQVEGYQWYGNVRELQNFVERAAILLRGTNAPAAILTDMMRRRPANGAAAGQDRQEERTMVEEALCRYPESMEDAARSLGYSRQTLWRKMKKYGITRP